MRESVEKGYFGRWGQFMFKNPLDCSCNMDVFICFFGTFAQKVPELLKDSGFTPVGSESDIGIHHMEDDLDFAPSTLVLVNTIETQDFSKPEANELILIREIQITKTPRLEQARTDTQSVMVELNLNQADALNHFPFIRDLVYAPEGMDVFVNGAIATLYDTQKMSVTKRTPFLKFF